MKNLLKKTVVLGVLVVYLGQATSVAYASWGLERLQQQKNQGITSPTTPSNTQPQQNQTPIPPVLTPTAPSKITTNQSTVDLIRSLRSNQTVTQNNNTTPQTPAPTAPIAPSVPQPTTPVDNQGSISSTEKMMLDLINKERTENGLKPLQWHAELSNVAKLKSEDMVKNNYFSHTSPTYGSFIQMVHNSGIPYRQVGENLAKAKDVQKAHVMFMASQGHRNNILSTSFTHVGIGITQDQYGIVITQLFIK